MKTLNLLLASAICVFTAACGDENAPSNDPLFVADDTETNGSADAGLTGPADEPRPRFI